VNVYENYHCGQPAADIESIEKHRMVFSSVIFLFLFLPVTLCLYFVVGKRFRNLFLLMASLVFYAWGETFYVAVMLASIGANYLFGLALERVKGRSASKPILAAA
jgi:alginate O-acetyltransferase complex protein AlgI